MANPRNDSRSGPDAAALVVLGAALAAAFWPRRWRGMRGEPWPLGRDVLTKKGRNTGGRSPTFVLQPCSHGRFGNGSR